MSIKKFFEKNREPHTDPQVWGSPVERERRKRIMLSLAAYAYEMRNDIIMSDPEFDKLCLEINPSIDTGHTILDKFFRDKFDPSTGMWIRDHPELNKVEELYERVYGSKSTSVRAEKTTQPN